MSISRGTIFEIELTSRLHLIPDSALISNFGFYSFALKRPTEIDRLLITQWGIYSIEAKSFAHEIIGTFCDDTWVGRSGSHATTIYNPVFQNFEHIRSLNNNFRRVGLGPLDIKNLVVVPDSCRVSSECKMVMKVSDALGFILNERSRGKKVDMSKVLDSLRKVKAVEMNG